MDSDLKGKVVLVTGASGGIGSAIARAFAAEGALVVAHCHRNPRRVEMLRDEIGADRCLIVQANLTREASVTRAFAAVLKEFTRIDSLVANAGAWETADVPLHKMSLRQWNKTMDGVLTATFLTVREFLRVVATQKRGNAVLISSTAAVFGEAGHADYAAAKAAIAYGLTRSLKNELARLAPHTSEYCGGRINCISPGWTVVPRLAKRLSNKEAIRKVVATMALPQLGRPEDMANACVFLASDRLARHVTGQNLVIAGGMEGRWLWLPNQIHPESA